MQKKLKFSNPWAEEPPTKSVGETADAPPPEPSIFDAGDQTEGSVTADVRLEGYGGLLVDDANTPTGALLRVLAFCLERRAQTDAVLTDYGVLIAQLPKIPSGGFYVRRGWDGWTLCVPVADTRDQAVLQIVQAVLELSRGALRQDLKRAGITAYRL